MMNRVLVVCVLYILALGNGLPIVISHHYNNKPRYSSRNATARMYCVNTCSLAGITNQITRTGQWSGNILNYYKYMDFYNQTCTIDCTSPTPELGGLYEFCLLVTIIILISIICGACVVGLVLEIYKKNSKNTF